MKDFCLSWVAWVMLLAGAGVTRADAIVGTGPPPIVPPPGAVMPTAAFNLVAASDNGPPTKIYAIGPSAYGGVAQEAPGYVFRAYFEYDSKTFPTQFQHAVLNFGTYTGYDGRVLNVGAYAGSGSAALSTWNAPMTALETITPNQNLTLYQLDVTNLLKSGLGGGYVGIAFTEGQPTANPAIPNYVNFYPSANPFLTFDTPNAAPEPTSLALAAIGLIGAVMRRAGSRMASRLVSWLSAIPFVK